MVFLHSRPIHGSSERSKKVSGSVAGKQARPIKPVVWIGWDDREDDAWKVCVRSMWEKASVKPRIMTLVERHLRAAGIFTRKWHHQGGLKVDDLDGKPFSTDFAFTRFLVPYLQKYSGWVLFCDCDILWRYDVNDLFALRRDRYAVMTVKHDYKPQTTVKMDGCSQQKYSRKLWSSVMLINCGHKANRVLTPDVVNTESGRYLHNFEWLKDEEIGSIPEYWNWIPGHSSDAMDPRAVHFTEGCPCMPGYENVHYADEWRGYAR